MLKDFVLIDLETTGLEPAKDAILEVAVIKVKNGEETERWESLVNPEREISKVVTSVTGITQEMVKDAPKISEVMKKVRDFCGDLPIMGHNVGFDREFLEKAGGGDLPGVTFDTFFLSQVFLAEAPSHSLGSLARSLGLIHENAHRAMGDIEVNLDFWRLLEKRAAEVDPQIREKMSEVMKKAGQEHLAEWILGIENGGEKVQMEKQEIKVPELKNKVREKCEKIWEEGEKGIFENGMRESDWVQFLTEKGEKVILVPKEFGNLKDMFEGQEGVNFWEEGSWMLDQKKLEELMQQEKLEVDEARVIWKILGAEGEQRGNFRIFGVQENRIWERLAKSENENEEDGTPVLMISQRAFWRGEGWEKGRKGIWVMDGNGLLDSADGVLKVSLHEGILAGTEAESTVKEFFQEAGRILVNGEEGGKFATALVLEEKVWGTEAGKKLRELLLKLSKEVKEIDEEVALQIELLTKEDEEWLRVAWVWPDSRLIFNAVPTWPGEKMQEKLGKFEQGKMGVPSLLGLPILRKLGKMEADEWPVILGEGGEKEIEFVMHFSDTEKKDDEFVQKGLIAGVKGWLESGEKKLLILCNSVHAVEKSFLALEDELGKDEVKILGEGMSGGKRKILDDLGRNEREILVCRFEWLDEREKWDFGFQTVILVKVPFDPPKQPILMKRARVFQNDFAEMTVPRAALRVARSLPPETKKVICLDHNLSKDWAKPILEVMGVKEVLKRGSEEIWR